MMWRPMGSPPSVKPQGMLAAVWPLMLKRKLKGLKPQNSSLDRLPIDDLWRLANCKGRGGHHGAQEQVVLVEDAGHVEAVPFEAAEGEGELLSGPGHGVFKERAEGVGQLVGVLGQ